MLDIFKKEKLTKEEKDLKMAIDDIINNAEKTFYRKNNSLSDRKDKKFKAIIIKQYETIKKESLRDININDLRDKSIITTFLTADSVGVNIPVNILISQLQEKVKKTIISPIDLRKEINIIKYLYYSKNKGGNYNE